MMTAALSPMGCCIVAVLCCCNQRVSMTTIFSLAMSMFRLRPLWVLRLARMICCTWWDHSTPFARLAKSNTAAPEYGRGRSSTRFVRCGVFLCGFPCRCAFVALCFISTAVLLSTFLGKFTAFCCLFVSCRPFVLPCVISEAVFLFFHVVLMLVLFRILLFPSFFSTVTQAQG